MMTEYYSGYQRTGSEFGGVARTPAGVQPKPPEAINNTERLRLGYTTGEDEDWMSIEDTRQFYGLRPANGKRPDYLFGASPDGNPRLDPLILQTLEIYEDLEEDHHDDDLAGPGIGLS